MASFRGGSDDPAPGPKAAFSVTILMPVRNEEDFLHRCLESVAANDYPSEQLEVLVLDGMSTDRSVGIAESFRPRIPGLRVVPNPGRLQAAGFNLGLAQANGEIIVRMDAHTTYARDYVRECVRLLAETGAANVGGPARAIGETSVGRAIAFAVSSRFGAGDSVYRYADRMMEAESVFPGAWRKDTLLAVGGMRADWAVNEDYELNYRIRRAGGRVVVAPSIRCLYYVRGTLGKLAKQYCRYGFWRARTVQRYPASLRWRQLIPPALVVYLVGLAAVVPSVGWWPAVPVAIYLGILGASVVQGAATLRQEALWLVAVFPVIHLAWGAGFLGGLCYWWIWPRLRRFGGRA